MYIYTAPTAFRGELPFTSEAPSIARAHLRSFAHGVAAEALDDAVLMVSELVTNALVHGQPAIFLGLRQSTDRLSVAVDDFGTATVEMAAPVRGQVSGRGLIIVNALATRWGVSATETGPGKQVWFDVGS